MKLIDGFKEIANEKNQSLESPETYTTGMTLNIQLVDLLSILDDKSLSKEAQDAKIEAYIEALRVKVQEKENTPSSEVYTKHVDAIIDMAEGIQEDKKPLLKEIYKTNLKDLSVCDKSKMEQILAENGLDPEYHTKIASTTDDSLYEMGILDLTSQDVRNFYNHLFEGGNRYDRITIDNAGKFGGYVAFDGETYTRSKMDRIMDFCEHHQMKAKVNTLIFYNDFPVGTFGNYLEKRVAKGEISEDERRAILKQTLTNYVKDMGASFGDRLDAVDIFNELIYDPEMLEPGFGEGSDFAERKTGWQKYLSLDDLCDVALEARKAMPNVTFTYNDVNWVNPRKRELILDIIKRIQAKEIEFKQEGKLGPNETLIDTIGVEAHIGADIDIDDFEQVFVDIQEQIGLPTEVTELDISRWGKNPASRSQELFQQRVLWKINEISKKYDVRGMTIWSQSDKLSFMNDKCGGKCVYPSVLNDKFEEKEFAPIEEIEAELGIDKVQDFNWHTHTYLCGHATEEKIEEYVKKAIAAGITKLGFSDHAPSPFGHNPNLAMSMKQFEEIYIPTVQELKRVYENDIDLKVGLEAEYFGDEGETYTQIKAVREKTEPYLDYMILGQHMALARDENGKLKVSQDTKMPYLSNPTSIEYPLDYAQTVVEAIKSGKFAYVAHPDIFLEKRDQVKGPKDEYERNAKKAIEMICSAAKEYDIPLEVNLGAISAIKANAPGKKLLNDGSYPYPVMEFWKVAEEKGCRVLIGIDAHDSNAIENRRAEKIARILLANDDIHLEFEKNFKPKGIGHEGKALEILEKTNEGDGMSSPEIMDKKEAFEISTSDIASEFALRGVEGKEKAELAVNADQKSLAQDKQKLADEK